MTKILLALRLFLRNLPVYFTVVFLCYGPWMIVIKYFAASGALTDDGAEAIAGLFSIFFMPLSNGATVWLNQAHVENRTVTIREALSVAVSVWKDLITAYLSVGFIMVGWLAVAVIPGGILMLVLGIKTPLVLLPFAAVAMIYVMTRYVFLDFYIVLRRLPGWTARRTCSELTRGRMVPLVASYIILGAPLYAGEFGFSYIGTVLEQSTGLSRHMFEVVLSIFSTLIFVVTQLYFYLVYREYTAVEAGQT